MPGSDTTRRPSRERYRQLSAGFYLRGGYSPRWDFRDNGSVALNIKNEEVERLAAEIARMTGETKTEAIRRALAERRQRLSYRHAAGARQQRVQHYLEREVWPRIPADQLGRRLSRAEEDRVLGYGAQGL